MDEEIMYEYTDPNWEDYGNLGLNPEDDRVIGLAAQNLSHESENQQSQVSNHRLEREGGRTLGIGDFLQSREKNRLEGIDSKKQSTRDLESLRSPRIGLIVEMQCEYCDKSYKGRNARSIYKRHLAEKHNIPLNTQARKTRWDNNPNRPTNADERRERTLESKRRWARENREKKKRLQLISEENHEDSRRLQHQLLSPSLSQDDNEMKVDIDDPSSSVDVDTVTASMAERNLRNERHSHEETEAAAVLFGLSSEAGPIPRPRKTRALRTATAYAATRSGAKRVISQRKESEEIVVPTASSSSVNGIPSLLGNKRKRKVENTSQKSFDSRSVSSSDSPLQNTQSHLRSPLLLDQNGKSLVDPQLLEEEHGPYQPTSPTFDGTFEETSDNVRPGEETRIYLPSSTPRPTQMRHHLRRKLLPPGDSSPPEMPDMLPDSSPLIPMNGRNQRTRQYILPAEDPSILQTPPPPTFGLDRRVLGIPSSVGPGDDPIKILGIGRKVVYAGSSPV